MGAVRALRTANKVISLINYRRGVPSKIASVVSPANKQGLSIALHEEAVEERLAFDATPSFQEAIAATSDLKAAIQTFNEESETQDLALRKRPRDAHLRNSAAIQALSLLPKLPAAQKVVASIASDKNVWDAVLNNKQFKEFCDTHLNTAKNPGVDDLEVPVVMNLETSSENSGTGLLLVLLQDTKMKLSEMMSSLFHLVKNFLGTSIESCSSVITKTPTAVDNDDNAIQASFVALAVATIFVVLFKRLQP
ncbi:hypothetical protein OPV22_016749 [Ensete ventricosum]|uniref:Uncharacterized protein n=1 Tax=Ensete ventricosum TaxID=4639 RepID=A0AAV8QW98_ENSVE|nr:hypothetical protein OPV22_016749 [Ensete ventricosum]